MSDAMKYVDREFEHKIDPPKYPYGANPMGYGNRIATSRKIRFKGEKIWRRVYCICWSNSGTCYVETRGETLYFRSTDFL